MKIEVKNRDDESGIPHRKQLRDEYFLERTELALLVSHLASDHAIVLCCHIFQRLTVE